MRIGEPAGTWSFERMVMGLAGVVDLGTYGERLDAGPLRLLCAGTTDTGRCPPNCVADPGVIHHMGRTVN